MHCGVQMIHKWFKIRVWILRVIFKKKRTCLKRIFFFCLWNFWKQTDVITHRGNNNWQTTTCIQWVINLKDFRVILIKCFSRDEIKIIVIKMISQILCCLNSDLFLPMVLSFWLYKWCCFAKINRLKILTFS